VEKNEGIEVNNEWKIIQLDKNMHYEQGIEIDVMGS